MTTNAMITIKPPGRNRHCHGDIALLFELEHGGVRMFLTPTKSAMFTDPNQLENIAHRIAAAAATLRRYREHGEVPLIGGRADPNHPDWWWQD